MERVFAAGRWGLRVVLLPTNAFVTLPLTLTFSSIGVCHATSSVPLVVFPLSDIPSSVLPSITSIPVFLVLYIFSLVLLSIWPTVDPSPMHGSFTPITLISPSIGEHIASFPMELVVLPLPVVNVPISPYILSLTGLHSFDVVSYIATAVVPTLSPPSMLQIASPLALILRSISTDVNTCPVGFVMHPLSFVDIPIIMSEFSDPPCRVLFPLTHIFRSIRPNLRTFAFPHSVLEISVVDSSVFEADNLTAEFTLLLTTDRFQGAHEFAFSDVTTRCLSHRLLPL